jgi:UbiD family decarboxylase
LEGPFGEYTGHFCTLEPLKKPTVYLSAVTYRNNPIYQGCSPGIPPNEETTYREIGLTVGVWYKLLKAGVPGIKEVYATEMGTAGYVLLVSMDRQYYMGNARQVIHTVFGAAHMAKWVIVVDDDIDIYDRGQVEWALAVKFNLIGHHCNRRQAYGWHINPSIHHDRKYHVSLPDRDRY